MKKRAAAAIKSYELKAYANGNVFTRTYFGNDVDAAAARFAVKHNAAAVRVYAVNYYGNVVDEYMI